MRRSFFSGYVLGVLVGVGVAFYFYARQGAGYVTPYVVQAKSIVLLQFEKMTLEEIRVTMEKAGYLPCTMIDLEFLALMHPIEIQPYLPIVALDWGRDIVASGTGIGGDGALVPNAIILKNPSIPCLMKTADVNAPRKVGDIGCAIDLLSKEEVEKLKWFAVVKK